MHILVFMYAPVGLIKIYLNNNKPTAFEGWLDGGYQQGIMVSDSDLTPVLCGLNNATVLIAYF